MDELNILLRFLRYTTSLPVFLWDGTVDMMAKYEENYCFSKQVQPLLSAQGLQAVLERLELAHLYEVEDILGVHYFAFLFRDAPIVVGPFVTGEWNDSAAEVHLTEAGLSASYLLPYKLYYCSYIPLDRQIVTQVITGAITAVLPDAPPYLYQKLSGTLGHRQRDLHSKDPFNFESAVRLYALENEFLALIEEGQTEAALHTWERLSKIPSAKELSIPGPQGLTANAAVLRTLVRKAAERGGVHPAVVDTISLSYAQKMYTARSMEELMEIMPAMIREFSEAVSTSKAERYSLPVSRTVSYLRLHVSQDPDMKQLSALAKCGTNHLGRQFKAETGLTIIQFLAMERCHKAAVLLAQTDLPVQDIGAHVGYLDNNYFAKVFKACMGDTPTVYRRKFRR